MRLKSDVSANAMNSLTEGPWKEQDRQSSHESEREMVMQESEEEKDVQQSTGLMGNIDPVKQPTEPHHTEPDRYRQVEEDSSAPQLLQESQESKQSDPKPEYSSDAHHSEAQHQ